MTIEILATETKHEGWARFVVATVRLPDGHIIKREIEDHGQAVCVLPYDPVRRTGILVEQFRAPVFFATRHERLLEAIAGIVETTDPAACARREALEEAGLTLRALEPVGITWSMPGLSTERIALYLAPYEAADRINAGGGLAHEHENITVVELPLSRLAAQADAGSLTDLKTLALVQTLRLRHPSLFV